MAFDGIIDRYVLAGTEFGRRLRAVRPEQWTWPTPCSEWNVRQLVNHMTRGNLSYAHLLHGGTNADFLRERDLDALGTDPVGAYQESLAVCASAFGHPGALDRMLDYPLGKITGAQALAVRATDSVIHTWDLARAVGADERLHPELVTWIDDHITDIYADLAESPIANTTHRFFAAPTDPARTSDPAPTSDPSHTTTPRRTTTPGRLIDTSRTTSPECTINPSHTASPDHTSNHSDTTSLDDTTDASGTVSPAHLTEPSHTTSIDRITSPDRTTGLISTIDLTSTTSLSCNISPRHTINPSRTADPSRTTQDRVLHLMGRT